MSVLQCLMMSHEGELLARYRGLLNSHHEYVQCVDSRLRRLQERCATFQGLDTQVFNFQKWIADMNNKLASSDGAFVKAKAMGNERNKKIKSLTKNLDQLNAEVAYLSTALNQATVLEAEKDEEILWLKASPPKFISNHAGEPLSIILQLELEKLARPANVPAPRDTCVSPPVIKESTVTPISSTLELLSNTIPSSSIVSPGKNEEWVNAMVDGLDNKMMADAGNDKPENVFVQGVYYVADDYAGLSPEGSERVSSGPNDVVISLST
ncbi:hypothetical protein Tco_0086810 [Tanacetum coccineum]